MKRRTHTSPSESFVQNLLNQRYSVQLRKLPVRHGKPTPDFKAEVFGEPICTCELKALGRVPRTEAHGWKIQHHADGSQMAERLDNSASRVSDAIHEAYKQLKHYRHPRALIVLNRDSTTYVSDLEDACSGQHVYASDHVHIVNTSARKIARGKIRNEFGRIDLYIWIDDHHGTEVLFRCATQCGYDLAQRHFNPEGHAWAGDDSGDDAEASN